MSGRRSLKVWEQRISRQAQFLPGHMSGRVDSAQPIRRLGGTVRRPWIGAAGAPATPAPTDASLRGFKYWTVNGTTYPNGSQPAGLTAQFIADGVYFDWGQLIEGITPGRQGNLSETVTISGSYTQVGAGKLTHIDGTALATPLSLPYLATLHVGLNTFVITNTLTSP